MSSAAIEQSIRTAIQHHVAGRLREAEALYREILECDPRQADAVHGLGFLSKQAGRLDEAQQLVRRAIEINPATPDYFNSLGMILLNIGQSAEAIESLQRALFLMPTYADAMVNLGNALCRQGRWEEAADWYRRAIERRPTSVEAQTNLGNALQQLRRPDEALAAYRAALALRPNFAPAHDNFGTLLEKHGDYEQAMACYRKAVELQPNYCNAVNNLGNVCARLGRVEEAVDWFHRAIQINPASAEYHSNLLFWISFHPGYDGPAILRQHLAWKKRHADTLQRFIQPLENERSPDRRLRIGYVSQHFCTHCVSLFTTTLFQHHDRQKFEIFAYSNVVAPDRVTAQIRAAVDHWRDISTLTDEHAVEQIREDRIDILVDLGLHMGGNRLLIFARKPAPVQVTWIGYPGTTGLDAIDYRVSDPHLDPPGEHDDFYVEKTVRLPHTFWCYGPAVLDGEKEPEIGPPPCVSAGGITFGCLNNFAKVNDRVLEVWAEVLAAVPGSRLLLLAPPGKHRQAMAERLLNRVEFVDRQARANYLATYNRIDIALDTFPANGHTTSLDTMWMGVPVVTLAGGTAIARGGLSMLANVGLTELAARSPEEFVRIASELAADVPRLVELRATLRGRLKASPPMDASRFGRNIEAAYREMWKRWVTAPETNS